MRANMPHPDRSNRWLRPVTGLVLLLAGAVAPVLAAEAGGEISLRDAEIRMAPGLPLFVNRAVEDLRTVIAQRTGRQPETAPADAPDRIGRGPLIEVGLTPWKQVAESLPISDRGRAEAYVLTVESDPGESSRSVISIAGSDEQGLKFGVIELIRRLRLKAGDVAIASPLRVVGSPAMATRSMYAHLHWSYNRPYALRSWQLDDWKRYIDLLTHLGFNTIQIWPMMELLPHPLSPEDRAYLERYAQIVDYAHRERGMKVFIGSCPNNITEDAKGVPIDKREYFDFEKRLNPGEPAALQRLLEYRSDLYRTVPGADGYWMIDSDPGGWKGSPSSDFVDILVGHRKLIDRYSSRPKEQPLIYWMWFGWGTSTQAENWKATLADMKQRLPGPWMVHACNPEHLAVCRELDLLDRAIYFPYGTLEDEPSGPLTDLRLTRICKQVGIAREAGLSAVQGNTQTPLVQLPNIACLAYCGWHADVSNNGDAVLHELADRLLSKDAEVLVRAWRSLGNTNVNESLMLANQLHNLAKDPAAAGTIAVVMGDWQTRVIEDLANMLAIHAVAVVFAQRVAANAQTPELIFGMSDFIGLGGRWLDYTGYHNRDPITHDAFRKPVADALAKLIQKMGRDAMIEQIVRPATAEAERSCRPETCKLVVDSVLPK